MAEEKTTEDEPKKGGKMKKIIMVLLATVVLGGGGAAGGFYAAGSMGPQGPEKPDLPKLVLKDGTHVESDAKAAPDSRDFQVTYFEMEKAFTTNLLGGGFAQAEIAVSTPYDERVVEAIQEHDIAIRSAIVMKLAAGNSDGLQSQSGKEALAVELKDIINETLRAKTGFGGVDEVYFTKFVVQ